MQQTGMNTDNEDPFSDQNMDEDKRLQTSKYMTVFDPSLNYHPVSGDVLTCVQVNRLPLLVKKLIEEVRTQSSEELHRMTHEESKMGQDLDEYAIQTLFLNASLKIDTFNNEDEVYQYVKQHVLENLSKFLNPPDYYPFNYPTFYGLEHDIEQLVSYNNLMDSEEMVELRESYQTNKTASWTKDQRKLFKEGLEMYGYGHDSNRKIAAHMGVHPNQVAHEKQRAQIQHQKKRKKK